MRHISCLWLMALVGCAAPGAATDLLDDAEPNQVVRLGLRGDRVISTAVPIDYRTIPLLARTTCDAIAPDGELEFCGREQGPRGEGFRIEKGYQEPFPHTRSALVDEHGTVMERSHTLPIATVPQHILAAALAGGTTIDSVAIVSGPVAEEFFRIVTRDRRGRQFVVTVDLEGRQLGKLRRNQSRVDS